MKLFFISKRRSDILSSFRKTGMIMRMTLCLILCIGLIQTYAADSYAQTKKITIESEKSSISSIILDIEEQSDFSFMYNRGEIDLQQQTSIQVKNASINEILEDLFKYFDISYNIEGRHVILTPAEIFTLKGAVLDQDGEPITGAVIQIKGSSRGVITDIDGKFSIDEISKTTTILVSYIGMLDQEILVDNRRSITVNMEIDAIGLDEVVTIGYGTQKKVNLTGAVESIGSKDLENKGTANIVEALQGRVPNLNISYGGGGIDDTPEINVRGYTSLNGGGPLILIDGVPSDATILNQINPTDIENISVLKDAAASAIYGGRAAFGVILVTTKRGKNQKTVVNVRYNNKSSKNIQSPEFVDTYTHATTVNEAMANHGDSPRFKDDYVAKVKAYRDDPVNNPIDEITDPVYDGDGNLIGGDYYYFGTVDYMDEVFKPTSTQHKFDLSLSGGIGKTALYTSIGYTKDEGMFRYGNSSLDIYNFRFSSSTKVNKWLSFDTRGSYIKHEYDIPYSYKSWYEATYFQRSYFPIINRGNDTYLNTPIPYLLSGARDKYEDDDITLTAATEIKVMDGLKINGSVTYHSNVGLNKENKHELVLSDNFGYRYPVDAFWGGSASDSHIYHRTRQKKGVVIDLYGQYEKMFADSHNLKILVGLNQESYNELSYSAQRKDIISTSVPSMSLTLGEDYVSQSEYHWAIRGVFFRANYSYKDRYLFEVNGRYDGSSRFQESDRFGFFPSGSFGWKVTEEEFMKSSSSWLNNLKFRASYGTLGNQNVDTYAYIATMGSSTVNYILGGEKPISISNPDLVDPNLTWETVKTTNFGIDAAVLNSRLGVTFDIYTRRTEDMLVSGDVLPGILGTDPPTQNSADLKTNGWEATVQWRDQIGQVRYGVKANISDSKSFITQFNNPTGALSKYREGQEIGEIWGYETEGFFTTEDEAATAMSGGTHDQSYISGRTWKPGDIKYRDLNGDNKIDEGNQTISDTGDQTIIGNTSSRYNFGITANANYKGFSLEAFFQGTMRRQFVPSGSIFWPYYSSWDNIQTHQLGNTWTEDNQDAYFPQLESYAYRNYQTQSKYLQDAAYIRLKNLSVSYSIPKHIIEKAGMTSVLVSLNGANLWESHNLPEPFDPEGGNGLQTPFKRTYSLGININL